MINFKNLLKPRMWFTALLLATLVAACGDGGDGGSPGPVAIGGSPGPVAIVEIVGSPAPVEIVGQFYDQVFNLGNVAVVDQLVRADFVQHEPTQVNGPAALKDQVTRLKTAYPNSRVTVTRVLAEGDLVVVHSNLVLTPGTKGMAIFDISRVDQGKIAERWAVAQEVPNTTPSGNDMFSTLSSPPGPGPDPLSSASASKAVAMALFTALTSERDVTALDRYVAGPYYQHNAQMPNGIDVVKQSFTQSYTDPSFNVSVQRVIADGDLVAIHSHSIKPGGVVFAWIDLYRVRDGKVVEHWDVLNLAAQAF